MNDREAAIMELMPVARGLAGRFVSRYGRMSYPEALSAATLGIVEAVDQKSDVPIEVWAAMKARWQIGLDFRSQYAPRRKVRSEYISVQDLPHDRVAVDYRPESTESVREELDAAIASISAVYRDTAKAYFYGPTRDIAAISRQSGTPLMTCKRAVWAVRKELRRRMVAA